MNTLARYQMRLQLGQSHERKTPSIDLSIEYRAITYQTAESVRDSWSRTCQITIESLVRRFDSFCLKPATQ